MKPFLHQSPTAQIGMTCTSSKKTFGMLLKKNEVSITVEQMGILNLLLLDNNASMNDLAKNTFTDNSAITRIIDNLEKYGMVKRKFSEADRRLKLICITKKGIVEVKKANKVGKNYVAQVTKGINEKDIVEMISTLKKFRENIKKINE
ncbi:MAG: winged helix-turn-helix transcriptional regulator [Ignavibacteriae bacterium]|nr:winged helix-turn-helix transcriptional regulator [Ignavibacteriota bacterium]